MTERRCGDCEWMVDGECRRMPPTGIKPEIELTGDTGCSLNGRRFPMVRRDDWCGEFRPRAEQPAGPRFKVGQRVRRGGCDHRSDSGTVEEYYFRIRWDGGDVGNYSESELHTAEEGETDA